MEHRKARPAEIRAPMTANVPTVLSKCLKCPVLLDCAIAVWCVYLLHTPAPCCPAQPQHAGRRAPPHSVARAALPRQMTCGLAVWEWRGEGGGREGGEGGGRERQRERGGGREGERERERDRPISHTTYSFLLLQESHL